MTISLLLLVGVVTFSDTLAEPVRVCASLTVSGSVFSPAAVPAATVALNVNVLLGPSANVCAALPPIDDRSPTTVSPVLAGFVPGVTVTVRSVEPPASTSDGFADPVAAGDVEFDTTVTDVDGVVPVRPCSSVIVALFDLLPAPTLLGTTPVISKSLLPCCVNTGVPRPSAVRFPVTMRPLLAGFAPDAALTVTVMLSPGERLAGFAVRVPLGFVGCGVESAMPWIEMLSIASACALLKVEPDATE